MTVPPTLAQRIAQGQAQRKHLRRVDLAAWHPKARTQDPLKLLADAARGRVPALLAIKDDRMADSPFGYFRGAVPVMAYDLSLSPHTAILCQLCGDAHVRNLGAFEAANARLVFDINDFDETIPGPFEWDVKRMATSLILAAREAGANPRAAREAAALFLDRYRTLIHTLARMPVLEVARFEVHRLGNVEPISDILQAAERATPLHNLQLLTQRTPPSKKAATRPLAKTKPASSPTGPTHRTFKSIPPTLTPVALDLARAVLDSLTTYAQSLLPERRHFLAQYTPLDVAMKVVGTGSVGLRDYCVYLQGNGAKDPLFLQIKEEAASAYTPYLGQPAQAAHHQGQRVVEGQRAIQLQSDPFLGWTTVQEGNQPARDFLVRQLNDHKASIDLTALKAHDLLEYATVCGELLARGHARSGDSAMISGYIGTSHRFDDAIATFAERYADQTALDWKQLVHSRPKTPKPKAKPSS